MLEELLPKFGDPKTGSILNRLIADENLSLVRNDSPSRELRLDETLERRWAGLDSVNKLSL